MSEARCNGRPPARDQGATSGGGQPLVVALLDDQVRRWARGEAVRVEDYLSRHPTLRSDADGALDLIYQEFCLRQARGEAPQVGEYLERFPQWAAQLTLQFRVHRMVEAFDPPPPA
jgi:hypothetical protein